MQTATDTMETLIRGETIDWGATAIDFGVNFASIMLAEKWFLLIEDGSNHKNS